VWVVGIARVREECEGCRDGRMADQTSKFADYNTARTRSIPAEAWSAGSSSPR
jgi:hypothetical protein